MQPCAMTLILTSLAALGVQHMASGAAGLQVEYGVNGSFALLVGSENWLHHDLTAITVADTLYSSAAEGKPRACPTRAARPPAARPPRAGCMFGDGEPSCREHPAVRRSDLASAAPPVPCSPPCTIAPDSPPP